MGSRVPAAHPHSEITKVLPSPPEISISQQTTADPTVICCQKTKTFDVEVWKLVKLSAKQYIMPAEALFPSKIQNGGRTGDSGLCRISVSFCPRTRGFSNIGRCMQTLVSRKENCFFNTSELKMF